ncbi:hypothetical protein HY345_03215 [Candidatus Microgenomates bacterium]|nr:hypothetical protein [Candidatus Microgenomates bacterium]
MEYFVILFVVLLTSPFIIKLAQSQNKKSKTKLKNIFLLLLITQIILGFFNWENFSVGRNAYELSLAYPNSLIGSFFVITALEIFLLLLNKSVHIAAVVLNFINCALIFMAMIKISNMLGFQLVSFASVVAVFLALIGNVIGLAYINKDVNLLKKYFRT